MRNGILRTGIAAMLLVAIMAVAVVPAEAKELRITDYNLNVLQKQAKWTPYSYGELMLWPSLLDAKYQNKRMVGTIGATQVNDSNNKYPGECVSFAKALSKSDVATGSWTKGVTLFTYNLIAPGTVIATFGGSGGGYYGHTAIFTGEYTYSNGKRDGIIVWDQNYLPSLGKVVAKHAIKTSGTSLVTNASKYYTVVVP
ncbi:MAG: hypothetical protein WA063_03905 [Minisyncoccia bacterium]